MESIITGIIAGLTTGLLIYLFAYVWRGNIVPAYQRLIYHGVNISGEWHLDCEKSPDNTEYSQDEILLLRQTAHEIVGTATIRPRPGADGEVRHFDIQGILSDRILHLSMIHKDTARIGRIVYLAQVNKDGCELEGHCAYFDVETDEIATVSACFVRKRDAGGT
ncbi:MAG: hypothetical protein ACPGYV_03495 [Phycisphaeraceae bacterium]